jgi:hypothetical protein
MITLQQCMEKKTTPTAGDQNNATAEDPEPLESGTYAIGEVRENAQLSEPTITTAATEQTATAHHL